MYNVYTHTYIMRAIHYINVYIICEYRDMMIYVYLAIAIVSIDL